MRFILTNDDGIDAPGLAALAQALRDVNDDAEATIVAPLHHHSGCSHQVTTHRPMQVERRSEAAYAVAGTPADCIRVALSHLELKPDFVLSGINAGGNLGADLYISGTVAAVREAALYRIPGIALSHYIHCRQPIDWARANRLAGIVLDKLCYQPQLPGSFWNVNLPHLASDMADPALVFCPLCTQPLPAVYESLETGGLQYAGDYGKRRCDPGSDVEVCFAGQIAVTAIQLWG
ncbi:MAG: 5'/3'-nucleotidase SurE [Pegethrix bostrychoides GSE-TBD4-15B]|jgi:5'-nucleotidase|uniref:5'-nucleotidase n=1 Tax=Pegethrix bostrychoides GSE-TBD4-15B TaxID=2839662 RepID=A0A951U7D5_9CYAN|nr:5'/3'-nucleotidase SurE [Pegethrix bostrychoides GSE-TBD4-15B]